MTEKKRVSIPWGRAMTFFMPRQNALVFIIDEEQENFFQINDNI
jgi:hypothetical protein